MMQNAVSKTITKICEDVVYQYLYIWTDTKNQTIWELDQHSCDKSYGSIVFTLFSILWYGFFV